MAQEIERKFLVKDDSFKELAFSFSRIAQGYICSTRGRTVRVRIRDDKGYLTIKGPAGENGLSRYEWEKELIDKIRYLVQCGKHVYEVDEFYGDNEGLVVAEIELASEDESFEKPDFIGEEVTGIVKYYNSFLMKFPYSKW